VVRDFPTATKIRLWAAVLAAFFFVADDFLLVDLVAELFFFCLDEVFLLVAEAAEDALEVRFLERLELLDFLTVALVLAFFILSLSI
jgi:hypothetical protein